MMVFITSLTRTTQMTKEEKQELYKPKWYDLFENGIYVCTFESHSEAKRVKHQKIKESYQDCSDDVYEIKPHKE